MQHFGSPHGLSDLTPGNPHKIQKGDLTIVRKKRHHRQPRYLTAISS
jgi:hypothetical protein